MIPSIFAATVSELEHVQTSLRSSIVRAPSLTLSVDFVLSGRVGQEPPSSPHPKLSLCLWVTHLVSSPDVSVPVLGTGHDVVTNGGPGSVGAEGAGGGSRWGREGPRGPVSLRPVATAVAQASNRRECACASACARGLA